MFNARPHPGLLPRREGELFAGFFPGYLLLIFYRSEFFLEIHDRFDLHQKPAVNFRQVENLLFHFINGMFPAGGRQ
jgi:hypothetical protein